MGQAISVFLPLLLFMLTPVFIPVVTGIVGRIHDGITGARKAQSAAERAVEAARHRAAAARQPEAPAHHRALVS